MTNIDFLPARYKEQHATRRKHAWRLVVVCLFGSSVVLAALFQNTLHRTISAQLEASVQQYGDAESRRAKLTTLQADLRLARHEAELYTYLQHPWPRSQILAAIADPLPEGIAVRMISVWATSLLSASEIDVMRCASSASIMSVDMCAARSTLARSACSSVRQSQKLIASASSPAP